MASALARTTAALSEARVARVRRNLTLRSFATLSTIDAPNYSHGTTNRINELWFHKIHSDPNFFDVIDRALVYQFAMHMQRLALVTGGGSVTILRHPSLAGIASRVGPSGSTGWQGAFRFHQYLHSVKVQGDEPDNDLRELQFKKNQYGPLGERIVLRYQRGPFLPAIYASSIVTHISPSLGA